MPFKTGIFDRCRLFVTKLYPSARSIVVVVVFFSLHFVNNKSNPLQHIRRAEKYLNVFAERKFAFSNIDNRTISIKQKVLLARVGHCGR